MRERTRLEASLDEIDSFERELADNLELLELAESEDDADVAGEAEGALKKLQARTARAELQTLLSGEADANDCYLEVHAGAGGTEAQDWAEMLLRMYSRWAEAHGHTVEWLEESAGEEAGLKSATVKIIGHNAYGWLKTESGVHRLVRISPYDSSSRRHTSFASAWVYPVIDDEIEIEIEDKDLRVDTYRASGAGGHAGQLSPFALIQEIREWFNGPLFLSGAIAKGDSILAAQAMGADGGYAGSAFIATQEANADARYKQMIADSGASEVVYSDLFTGVWGNYLKASIEAQGMDPNNLERSDPSNMNFGADREKPKSWKEIWGAGQGIGAVKDVRPAAEVVERMATEYAAARKRLFDQTA